MPTDLDNVKSVFSELLTKLGDGDLVVEIASTGNNRQALETGPVRQLQEAVRASYAALAGEAEIQLHPVAVLEEVTRQSLSVCLRVRRSDDGARSNSADGSLLKFLARGTLAIIAWMDGSQTLQLADLQQAIRVLAWGTSITTSAQPALPSSTALIDAIAAWQKAKTSLVPSDLVRISTNAGSATLDLSKQIEDPRGLLLSRTMLNNAAEMIFIVEMPDYSGSREWKLRHGDARTAATAEPGTLLDRFYSRDLDIRPGDGLRCKVDVETAYGSDYELLSERYRILEVIEVLPPTKTAAPQEPGSEQQSAEAEAQPAGQLEDANS